MKALRATRADSSSTPALSIEDVPTPSAGPNELLVKIRASSVQPSDVLNSQGSFTSTSFPRTLGRDFAGTVTDGPAAWKGKHVYGTSGRSFSFTVDGAQAEYAVVPAHGVAEKPASLTFAQAASLGTPLTTANLTLVRARARAGETVMVLGATGAVGGLVMQIARAKGCKTIGVGRHGTDVNSVEDPTLARATELTNGAGPDVVVDTVGDFDLVQAAFRVLGTNGRVSIITAPRGGASTVLPVDILALYRRQISLIGCNSLGETQEDMAGMLAEMAPRFDAGELKAPEEKSMSLIGLDQAPDAYAGKIKRAVIVFD